MPKLGAEPIRRAALVKATIEAVGAAGSLDVTVAQIARRAGMSSALAHHYFGSKEQIFLAAMRSILTLYGAEVRGALAMAQTPRDRVQAVVMGSFAPSSFRNEAISAWLNFYVLAQSSAAARRLLAIYQARLRSNLLVGLRPIVGLRAEAVADGLGALIDGVYIRAALAGGVLDRRQACDLVLAHLELELEGVQ
ncbi:BetI family transcriptional regulator [Thioclava dalianensis]|uniref:HTH-type transcriptional regulator BetI n=1 Tax=Thioclava dalianensis TaxID=1185766 RepID=A0A074TGI5_9RHOB|nr:transcriptional regulator BetI [Thioclava dalianensis]KEP70816.1 BetI family transcriptional regulator [Thioclava dalianensis]SFN11662.1 transcriptional regulator, TetR family [Thioclava dalianensis]